jgi:hypothetical protein
MEYVICQNGILKINYLFIYSSNMCQSRPNENLAGGKVAQALYYGI